MLTLLSHAQVQTQDNIFTPFCYLVSEKASKSGLWKLARTKNDKCSVRIFLSHRHRVFSTIPYYMRLALHILRLYVVSLGKGKGIQLQAWSGPEGSRKLRFPDYVTTAQNGGKFVSPTQRPPLPLGNVSGTHFC